MKKKKAGVAIITIPILAAGTVALAATYKSEINFRPDDSSKKVQVNQVVFEGDDTGTGHKKNQDGDESHLLQKKSEEGNAASLEEQANYLFESGQLHTESVGISDNTNTEQTDVDNAQKEETQPSSIYNVTNDNSRADTVLNNPQNSTTVNTGENNSGTSLPGKINKDSGKNNKSNPSVTPSASGNGNSDNSRSDGNNENTGNSGNNGSNSGNNNSNSGGNNGNNSDKNNGGNSGGNTTRPADRVQDPESEKSNTDMGSSMGIVSKPYQEGVKPAQRGDETESGDYTSVTIFQTSTQDGNVLYEGQKITRKDVYNALDTWVYGADGVRYMWGADALDNYIRIDEVSFDDGQTWTSEFPLTIPESKSETSQMKIKVSYRFSTKDTDWYERTVGYELSQNRIFVLSEQLKEENEVIDKDTILNSNQHPNVGSMIYFGNSVYIYSLLGDGYQTALLPGWTENGELLPWVYQVQKGRHILEPADMIPLKEGYQVKLAMQWMSENCEVGFQYDNLVYLQTLTGATEEVLSQEKIGNDVKTVLSVPKYVQIIDLDGNTQTETDYLEIPDTVLSMNTDFQGLRVDQGYRVDAGNKFYCSTEDGILANKEQTEYLAVPCKIKLLEVPETVTKVNLSANNELSTLHIAAAILDEMPEISYENLKNCKTIVKDALLDSFVEKNYNSLKNRGNTIAAEENPEILYTVKNEGIISNRGELRKVFSTGRHNFRVPSEIKVIQSGAFDGNSGLNTIILPSNGETVELQENCLEGSEITTIRCYSDEQYESVTEQLEKSGAPEGVKVEFTGKSLEGIGYVRTVENDKEEIMVLDAPDTLTSFDGILTAENGEKLSATAIGDDAFENCKNLEKVTLPESVKSIGYQAFRNCTSLQSILIKSTDYIYVGDKSMDGCESLRFVASNAYTGEMQNSYNPGIVDESGSPAFYIPEYSEGYGAGCVYFMNAGISSYDVIDIGDGCGMLYGLDSTGNAWLGIRCESEVPDQVTLPASTVEIYCYAMAGTTSPSGNYTVNWTELPDLSWVDEGGFKGSDLFGGVVLGSENPNSSFGIGKYAFQYCRNIRSVTVQTGSYNMDAAAFDGCTALRQVEFKGSLPGYIFTDAFYNCNNLSDITFGSSEPTDLGIYEAIYSATPFQFNSAWSEQEETQKLHIHVPEGAEMDYIKAWRYRFCGYYDYDDKTAYLYMWQMIMFDNFDSETWEYPSDETIMDLLESRLLARENDIRTMMGVDTLSELPDLYHYSYNDEVLTLLRVPSSVTALNLAAKDEMELPSKIKYVGSNAFCKAAGLAYLNIPASVSGIYENVFAGVTSEKVTLNFESDTPPELLDADGDSIFNFGISDTQLSIQVPAGSEESYIDAWKYSLSGYADADAVRQAAVANLGTSETGEEPSEEDIQIEMQRILLPTVNRLRSMMGLERIDESTLQDRQKETGEEQDAQTTDPETENSGENMEPETAEDADMEIEGENSSTDTENDEQNKQEEETTSDSADKEQPDNSEENGSTGGTESGEHTTEDSAQDEQTEVQKEDAAQSEEETQE